MNVSRIEQDRTIGQDYTVANCSPMQGLSRDYPEAITHLALRSQGCKVLSPLSPQFEPCVSLRLYVSRKASGAVSKHGSPWH
jgi:hypothetical protein